MRWVLGLTGKEITQLNCFGNGENLIGNITKNLCSLLCKSIGWFDVIGTMPLLPLNDLIYFNWSS